MNDLATALGLVLVIEGLLWAAIPGGMKQAMALALTFEESRLRNAGLGAAGAGLFIVWLLRG